MKRSCPYSSKFTFEGKCTLSACPLHASRTRETFIFDTDTECTKMDAPHIIDALVNDSLANLDKTGFSRFNHRRIRRELDSVLGHSRTIVQLHEELPPDNYCTTCGAPIACQSGVGCQRRIEWVQRVLEKLRIKNAPPIVLANVWNKLLNGTLELNDAVMERHGRAYLSVNK